MAKYNIKFYADRIFNKNVSKLKFNGVYVEGNFDGFIINGANFKGVKGKVIINPQKVNNKNLYRAILADTYIDGSFEGCYILGTNFKNAKGQIRINPQFIKNKDLSSTVLDGVYIDGSFDDCIINQTNFENHKGKAVINPQTIKNKELISTVFSGVNFTGSFDGCKLYNIDFTDSVGACINFDKIIGYEGWGLNSNFRDAKLYNWEKESNLHQYVPCRFKFEIELSIFSGATLVYTTETKYMANELKKYPNLKDAIFENQDEQFEAEIRNIFENEIESQKVKQKVKK